MKVKFQNLPTTQSLQVVQLGDPLALQQQGILSLQIPGNISTYQFKAKYVQIETNGDFTWIGDMSSKEYCEDGVTENTCAYGTISLVKKSSSLFGEVQIDDLTYQIKDLGQGLNALILLNAQASAGDICGTPPGSEGIVAVSAVEDREGSLCQVRALVLYTQAAMDEHPDILNIIDLSIAETNQAFRNSNINEENLKLVLAGKHLLTPAEWQETGNPSDLNTFVTNTAIANYRAQFYADVVYIMTNDIYQAFEGAVTAFGDAYTAVDSAYAIVEAGSATSPGFIFAHETGHLFGARHERQPLDCGSAGDNSGLAHAHGFLFTLGCNCPFGNPKFFKTLMSICNDVSSRSRLQSYSNPNVKFNGKKTGNENTNYNAKVLAFASCRVANYVYGNTPDVIINAFNRICPGGPRAMTAVVDGVLGTITYTWETSFDGVNFGAPIVTNSNTFSIIAPLTEGATIFVRLTINNGNGIVLTTTKTFFADSEYCRPDVHLSAGFSDTTLYVQDLLRKYKSTSVIHSESQYKFESGEINIFPNPASSTLTIRMIGLDKSTISFQIIDALGSPVKEDKKYKVGTAVEQTEIDISDLANGVYWIKCESLTFHNVIRFVCQH